MLLFVYMYIDILKLNAYKLFKKKLLTSPGFFFKEANLFTIHWAAVELEFYVLEGIFIIKLRNIVIEFTIYPF